LPNGAEGRRLANVLAECLDEDGYEDVRDGEADEPKLLFASETPSQQRYICEVLAPFAWTYVTVAQSLQILHKNSMLESEFISFVINDLSSKVKRGSCIYGKSRFMHQELHLMCNPKTHFQPKAYPPTPCATA